MVRPGYRDGCAHVPDAVSKTESTRARSQDFPTSKFHTPLILGTF